MKKIFTNDKFFLACVLAGTIGRMLYTVVQMNYITEYGTSGIIRIIRILCLIGLYVSYGRHSKNTMKGLMGAILMAQVISSVNYCVPGTQKDYVVVFGAIYMILSVMLFVNHFLINGSRYAKPVNILTNQIIAVLLTVDTIVWSVWTMCLPTFSGNAAIVLGEIMDIFGNTGFYGAIVCVESRLDAYRLDRENAGWTEEKGYPDGYIHEYEKNK